MTLESVNGVCRAAAAGGGFLAGYLWAVVPWARAAGMGPSGAEMTTFAAGGLFLGVVYAALVGTLFAPARATSFGGLRMVVAPAAFTLSFAAGFVGIRVALLLVG